MKLRQLLPVVLMFVGATAFADHKHIVSDTHHLLGESNKLINTFKHNLVKSDKNHLIGEAKRMKGALAHFNSIWHKKIFGITVGHKHKAHSKMNRDFAKVTRRFHHLVRRFKSKPRPTHVQAKMNHLSKRFHHLRARIRRHAS